MTVGDHTEEAPAPNWLDNLRLYEPATAIHPQIYGNDRLGGAPAYAYSLATRARLSDGSTVACYHRAPAVDFSRPYGCCIGGAQTFGRGVLAPFPALLGAAVESMQIVNLGYGGAGPEFFLGLPEYLELCRRSAFVVLQLMSARSCSTSRYRVIWGNRGLDAAARECVTYPQFMERLRRGGAHERAAFVREVREAYVRDTIRLIRVIERPVVLLWISRLAPSEESGSGSGDTFPHFVDRDCVDRIRPHAAGYVEVIGSEDDFPFYYPGQRLHQRIFERVLERLVHDGSVRVRSDFDMRSSERRVDELEAGSRELFAAIRGQVLDRASEATVRDGHRPPR